MTEKLKRLASQTIKNKNTTKDLILRVSALLNRKFKFIGTSKDPLKTKHKAKDHSRTKKSQWKIQWLGSHLWENSQSSQAQKKLTMSPSEAMLTSLSYPEINKEFLHRRLLL